MTNEDLGPILRSQPLAIGIRWIEVILNRSRWLEGARIDARRCEVTQCSLKPVAYYGTTRNQTQRLGIP